MQYSGLILRIIPYSDNSRIIKCLTEESGLCSYFIRTSKKLPGRGHIQTGKYIAFTLSDRPSQIQSIKECQPDVNLGNLNLPPQAFAVWLFTLEMLNKTLDEQYSIPGLRKQLDLYYTHLAHGSVSESPFTPLILIANCFGIWNTKTNIHRIHRDTLSDLSTLGLETSHATSEVDGATFESLLNTIKSLHNIRNLESLVLLN